MTSCCAGSHACRASTRLTPTATALWCADVSKCAGWQVSFVILRTASSTASERRSSRPTHAACPPSCPGVLAAVQVTSSRSPTCHQSLAPTHAPAVLLTLVLHRLHRWRRRRWCCSCRRASCCQLPPRRASGAAACSWERSAPRLDRLQGRELQQGQVSLPLADSVHAQRTVHSILEASKAKTTALTLNITQFSAQGYHGFQMQPEGSNMFVIDETLSQPLRRPGRQALR